MKLTFLNLELAEVNVEGFPSGSVVKNPPANAGDVGLIPESGGPPGGGGLERGPEAQTVKNQPAEQEIWV